MGWVRPCLLGQSLCLIETTSSCRTYLTANSLMKATQQFIGKPYYSFTTALGTKVLVLGYLFNFTQEVPLPSPSPPSPFRGFLVHHVLYLTLV